MHLVTTIPTKIFYSPSEIQIRAWLWSECYYSKQNEQISDVLITFFFYVLFTVHLSRFISVINQLDAQNVCFTISLFHAPTCFEHMCSKHVEAWNKLTVKQKFCASSWLITEISIKICSSLCSNALNVAYVLCLAYPVLTFSQGKCVISDSLFGKLLSSNSGCMQGYERYLIFTYSLLYFSSVTTYSTSPSDSYVEGYKLSNVLIIDLDGESAS